MRSKLSTGLALLLALSPSLAFAQKEQREEDFLKGKPAIGDTIADLTVYSPDGKEVKTSSLRGHHTVLVFGCLT